MAIAALPNGYSRTPLFSAQLWPLKANAVWLMRDMTDLAIGAAAQRI
jgi:hypothetical protein